MRARLDDYLREMTDRLAFLNLEEHLLDAFDDVPSDFVIPILVTDIRAMATSSAGFTTGQIASAALYLLGIDPSFRFAGAYEAFLRKAVDRPAAMASELAMKSYDNRSYKDALIYLRAAALLDKDSKYPLFNLGQVALEFAGATQDRELSEELIAQAEQAFRSVLALDGCEPLASFQIGMLLLEKEAAEETTEEAKKHLKTAMQYGEDEIKDRALAILTELDAGEALVRAEELIDRHEYEAALAILEKSLSGELSLPLKYRILFARGFCRKATGDLDKAIEDYSQALSVYNQDTLLLAELGICYAYMGDLEQSLEFYLAALDLEKDSVELLNNIAIVYLNMKNFEMAKKYINIAKELANGDEVVDATILQIRNEEEKING